MKKLLPLLFLGAGAIIIGARKAKSSSANPVESSVKKVRIYVFEATWCNYCAVAKPSLLKVSRDHPKIPFQFIDFDSEKELASKFAITTLPTVIATVDGKEVRRIEGMGSLEQYEEMVAEATAPGSDLGHVNSLPGKKRKELPSA